MKEKKIIVGLGNSPVKFKGTRHNFGFDVIDSFCEKYDLKYDYLGSSCQLAKTRKSGYLQNKLETHAIVARPITYMNTCGPKIKKLLDKLEAQVENMLVIYDDIDLNLGRLRFRPNGSAGGHRGIKSIINSLGTDEFARLKLGIGPQAAMPSEKFVLEEFSKEEIPVKQDVINTSIKAIIDFCNQNIDDLMSKYNGVNHSEN